MGKSKKIAIIGHFADNTDICDGQTVKTRILYNELASQTDWKIIKVDTYYKRKRPLKLILDTMHALFSVRDIIVLLSINGMRLYFPILSWCAEHAGKHVYHDVIGGNLDKYVDTEKNFFKYLNSFEANWVETNGLKCKLEEKGLTNCTVIPNFKRLTILKDNAVMNCSEPYRFCTFSRVVKEKGIEDAINAIKAVNDRSGREVCSLDIYGPIGDEYKEDFEKILDKAPEYIKYGGLIAYDKSTEAISKYYGLLFPTFWNGEGFPGTIVDAFSAGVPVIASDWNCNAELVEDGVTGIVYPGKTADSLEAAVLWSIENKDCFAGMRQSCIRRAVEYMPEKYIEMITRTIEGN